MPSGSAEGKRLATSGLPPASDELGDLLAEQQADQFRVLAYHRAARTVRKLDRSISEIYTEGGRSALIALPTIGKGIAGAIEEMVLSGRWGQLERLRGESAPESLFQTLPGIGPKLAHAIHEHLHVDTLTDLEAAAHDGRLEKVPGIGPRLAESIRASLHQRFGQQKTLRSGAAEPSVAELLSVDADYRRQAAAGSLAMIAPRRFNPQHLAWLPILHTRHADWTYSVMFSNTARAHALRRTHDWVVIYFSHDHRDESMRTVVTETHGVLAGARVVRGREQECQDWYRIQAEQAIRPRTSR